MLPLLVLALGMFALGTGAFVTAGLLPPIAADLAVPVATVGQLVTVYAIAYAICTPLLAVATGALNRRRLLIGALCLFALANLLAALASSFLLLAAARMLAAVGAGLYSPAAMAVGASVAPLPRRAQALAVVSGGLTVANVFGVPLGTWIGADLGWRAAFGLVGAVSVLAALGVFLALRETPAQPVIPLSTRLALLRDRPTVLALSFTTLWTLSAFLSFTYIGPLLEETAGLTGAGLSGALFAFGVSGMVGLWLGGLGADRLGSARTITICMPIAALAMLVVPVIGTSVVGALVSLTIWSAAGWAVHPAQLNRQIALAPHATGVVLAFNASALYLGVALGAALGGIAYSFTSATMLAPLGGLGYLLTLGYFLLINRGSARAASPVVASAGATPDR